MKVITKPMPMRDKIVDAINKARARDDVLVDYVLVTEAELLQLADEFGSQVHRIDGVELRVHNEA